jgi:hypothetical protein
VNLVPSHDVSASFRDEAKDLKWLQKSEGELSRFVLDRDGQSWADWAVEHAGRQTPQSCIGIRVYGPLVAEISGNLFFGAPASHCGCGRVEATVTV